MGVNYSDLPPKAQQYVAMKMMAYRNRERKAKKKPKYGNQKCVVNGIEFDSRKEANRWMELKVMEKHGLITELERQVKFVLIPTQYTGSGKDRRVLERECAYIADFVYFDVNSQQVIVEDTKGYKTKDYIIKRKLMRWKYPHKFVEL